MKIIRYLVFTIIIPIICVLFFAIDGFCASPYLPTFAIPSPANYDTYVSNGALTYETSTNYIAVRTPPNSYPSPIYYCRVGNDLYFLGATYATNGPIDIRYKNKSNGGYGMTSFNLRTYIDTQSGPFYYFKVTSAGFSDINWDTISCPSFEHLADFTIDWNPPSVRPNRPQFDSDTSIGTLKNFKYSLVDSSGFDNLVDNYLQYAGLVDSDLLDYTSGIYQFSWDDTIDISIRHTSGQGGGNRVVTLPINAMRIEFGFLNVRTKDYFMQKAFWPVEDGFTNTFNPDFFSVSDYIELQLHNYLNVHPVYVFTPIVEYEGEKIYGESLFFDMYIKKLAGSSVGGGHQLENITEVTLPDGSTTDVGFGSGSTNLWKFLLDNWDDSEYNIDNSKEQTSYNNYVTNNHGLSVDDILYILTHDPRFQGGDNQIIISPEFDPAGISDDDDLWLGKLRELYQLTLRVPVWANLFIEQLAGMTPWVPSEFYSFLAAVFSVGVVLSIARLIRG